MKFSEDTNDKVNKVQMISFFNATNFFVIVKVKVRKKRFKGKGHDKEASFASIS